MKEVVLGFFIYYGQTKFGMMNAATAHFDAVSPQEHWFGHRFQVPGGPNLG